MRLQDTKDLVTGDESDLGNAVRVTKGYTNLRGGHALPGEFDDMLHDVLGSRLEPCGRSATIREGRGRNALALAVHATHGESSRMLSHISVEQSNERTHKFGES